MPDRFQISKPAMRQYFALGVLSWALLTAVFWTVPQGIWIDVAWQLKAAQQFVAGESPTPNHLNMPDFADLSRDAPMWMGWWSPGTNGLVYPLLRAGLTAGDAVRLLAVITVLLGSLGWIRYACLFHIPRPVAAVYSLGIPWFHYAARNLFSYSAESLLFAGVPWVLVLAHKIALQHPGRGGGVMEREDFRKYLLRTLFLGLAAGSLYVLKYSGIYVSLAVAAFFALISIRSFLMSAEAGHAGRLRRSMLPLLVLSAGIMLPVLALSILNWRLTRFLNLVIHTRRLDFEPEWLLFAVTSPVVVAGHLVSLSHLAKAWFIDGLAAPLTSAHLWWVGPWAGVLLAAAMAAPGTAGLVLALCRELRTWRPSHILAGSVFVVSAGCALLTWMASSAVSLEPRHVAAAGLAIIPFSLEAFATILKNRPAASVWIVVSYAMIPAYVVAGSAASVILAAKVSAESRERPAMGQSGIFDVLDPAGNIGPDLAVVTQGFDPATDVWYAPEPRVALDLPGRAVITLVRHSPSGLLANHKADVHCSSRDLRLRVLLPKSSSAKLRETILRSFPQAGAWTLAASGKSDYELWLGRLESGGEAGWRACQQMGVMPVTGVR